MIDETSPKTQKKRKPLQRRYIDSLSYNETLTMNRNLERERRSPSFSPEAITNVLDGSTQATERRREIEKAVRMSGAVFENDDNANMNRVERHCRALAKHLRLMELARKLRVDTTDCTNPEFVNLVSASADNMPTLLHFGMFVPCMKTLLSSSQRQKWLPLCNDCTVVGCYAQTELGHGSNVRALETTARFVDGGWVLNTPTLTSTKFWPGSLGKTANTAMVIARLVDGGGWTGGFTTSSCRSGAGRLTDLSKGSRWGISGARLGTTRWTTDFSSSRTSKFHWTTWR